MTGMVTEALSLETDQAWNKAVELANSEGLIFSRSELLANLELARRGGVSQAAGVIARICSLNVLAFTIAAAKGYVDGWVPPVVVNNTVMGGQVVHAYDMHEFKFIVKNDGTVPCRYKAHYVAVSPDGVVVDQFDAYSLDIPPGSKGEVVAKVAADKFRLQDLKLAYLATEISGQWWNFDVNTSVSKIDETFIAAFRAEAGRQHADYLASTRVSVGRVIKVLVVSVFFALFTCVVGAAVSESLTGALGGFAAGFVLLLSLQWSSIRVPR